MYTNTSFVNCIVLLILAPKEERRGGEEGLGSRLSAYSGLVPTSIPWKHMGYIGSD